MVETRVGSGTTLDGAKTQLDRKSQAMLWVSSAEAPAAAEPLRCERGWRV